MSEWQKVIIEADSRGRVSINAIDTNGAGHGHRLAGPKYVNDYVTGRFATVLAAVELDERDVKEIRAYLAIWDEIQARRATTTTTTSPTGDPR